MKKIATAVVALVTLVSCGGGGSEAGPSADERADAQTFWGILDQDLKEVMCDDSRSNPNGFDRMMLDERDWSPVELQALKDVMKPSCTADILLNVLDLGRMVDGKFGDGYEELLLMQAADIIDNYPELSDAMLDAEVGAFDLNQLFVNGEPLENTPFEPFADLVVEYWKSAETLKTEAVQTPSPEPRTDPGSDTGCSQCDYLIDSVEEDSAFCVQYGMTETGSFPVEEAAKLLGMTVSEYEMTMETICD